MSSAPRYTHENVPEEIKSRFPTLVNWTHCKGEKPENLVGTTKLVNSTAPVLSSSFAFP